MNGFLSHSGKVVNTICYYITKGSGCSGIQKRKYWIKRWKTTVDR